MANKTVKILVQIEVGPDSKPFGMAGFIQELLVASGLNNFDVYTLSVDNGSLKDKSSGELTFTTGELIRQELKQHDVSLYTYMECAEKGIKEYDE
mgnify:FL=1